MKSFDAVVIGAGPAGATAAFHLARGGLEVLVLERAPLPRYKPCGGGVVRRALKLLPFDVSEVVEVDCRRAELNLLDCGLHFTVERSEPVISMTMRSRFDALLLEEARRAGVEVWAGCAAVEVTRRRDVREVGTARGPVRASQVVLAGGAENLFLRSGRKPRGMRRVPALEWEVHPDGGSTPECWGPPRFDFGVVPEGYGWVFPKGDHLSVGLASVCERPVGLTGALERYLEAVGLRSLRWVERHGFVIPLRRRGGPLVLDGVLLVGDAAGLADPVTLEGISHAVASGRLAAEAILEARAGNVGRAYVGRLEREVLRDLRLAAVLSRVLYGNPWTRRWLFQRYGEVLCEVMVEVMCGERTYREVLGRPGSYVRWILGRAGMAQGGGRLERAAGGGSERRAGLE